MVGRAIQVNGHFFTLFGSLGSFCIIWLECPERNNEGETSLLSLAWCLLMERKKHNYHHPFQFETLKSKHKEIVLLFCLLSLVLLWDFFFSVLTVIQVHPYGASLLSYIYLSGIVKSLTYWTSTLIFGC